MIWAEETVQQTVQALRLFIESIGALTVLLGVVVTFKSALGPVEGRIERVRLVFARYLALALEFQLGADILSTTVAPSWDQIGKLAAVAVIRTALNFFLMKEIQADQANGEARS